MVFKHFECIMTIHNSLFITFQVLRTEHITEWSVDSVFTAIDYYFGSFLCQLQIFVCRSLVSAMILLPCPLKKHPARGKRCCNIAVQSVIAIVGAYIDQHFIL